MFLKKFKMQDKSLSKLSAWVFLIPCFLIGLLSAIRWPSAWTATHALFDYSQGFAKRSFYGNFLSFFFDDKVSYIQITLINFIIFFGWSIILMIIIKKIIDLKLIDYRVGCLFFISPAFIFQVHTIGYLEHVAFFLFFLTLLIRNFYVHIIFKFIIISVIPFIHEGLLLMITPLIIFDTFLFLKKNNLRFKKIISLIVIISIIGTCINAISKKNDTEIAQYEKYINEKALDFNPRGDNIETLSNDHIKLFSIMSDYWTRLTHWSKLTLYTLILLPLPIFLTFNLIRLNQNKNNKYYFYTLIISCLSPILLIPIAFDIERWFAMIQFTTFATIFIVCYRKNFKFRFDQYSHLFQILFILTCLTSIPLMDQYYLVKLPFYEHFENIWFSIKNDESLINIPWHR